VGDANADSDVLSGRRRKHSSGVGDSDGEPRPHKTQRRASGEKPASRQATAAEERAKLKEAFSALSSTLGLLVQMCEEKRPAEST
jgi:hypothetical protein